MLYALLPSRRITALHDHPVGDAVQLLMFACFGVRGVIRVGLVPQRRKRATVLGHGLFTDCVPKLSFALCVGGIVAVDQGVASGCSCEVSGVSLGRGVGEGFNENRFWLGGRVVPNTNAFLGSVLLALVVVGTICERWAIFAKQLANLFGGIWTAY